MIVYKNFHELRNIRAKRVKWRRWTSFEDFYWNRYGIHGPNFQKKLFPETNGIVILGMRTPTPLHRRNLASFWRLSRQQLISVSVCLRWVRNWISYHFDYSEEHYLYFIVFCTHILNWVESTIFCAILKLRGICGLPSAPLVFDENWGLLYE